MFACTRCAARRSHTQGKTGPGIPPESPELQAWQSQEKRKTMAVKIKLARFGKIRNPQYRISVVDARNRRDGRSIEVLGRYHPKEDPSVIEINSERALYWLGVGAQPTEATLRVAEPKTSKLDLFNAALAAADSAPSGEATTAKKKKAPAKKAEDAAAEAPAETAEAPAEAAPAEAAPAEAAPADAAAE